MAVTKYIAANKPFQINSLNVGIELVGTPNATLSYSVSGENWTTYSEPLTEVNNVLSNCPRYMYLKLTQDCIITEAQYKLLPPQEMSKFKEYFDSVWYSSLSAKLSVLSFIVGTVISCLCLFAVVPIGEIALSALNTVGMFLILSGAFGGVKVTFDLLNTKFSNQISTLAEEVRKKDSQPNEDSQPKED